MLYSLKTVIGNIREKNEDCVAAFDTDGLSVFAVADGMGGHKSGEVASSIAAKEFIKRARMGFDSQSLSRGELSDIINDINRSVFAKAISKADYFGMGTTLTAAVALDGMLYTGHVGDSRAYVMRNGRLCQITADHSYIAELVRLGRLTPEQAKDHPRKNIITRALGVDDELDVDTDAFEIMPGDIYLLCSDGLTNMVADGEIASIMGGGYGLDEMARCLVDLALINGGMDNISVVLFSPGGGA